MFATIAVLYIKNGNFKKAEKAIELTDEAYKEGDPKYEQGRSGRYFQNCFRGTYEDECKKIAIAYAKQGKCEKAIQIVEKISYSNSSSYRDDAFQAITIAYIEKGDYKKAEQMTNRITRAQSRYNEEIATAYATRGEIEKAFKIIDQYCRRDSAYYLPKLAELYAIKGDFKKALEIAQSSGDSYKARAFSNIAIVYAEKGELEKALEITEQYIINAKIDIYTANITVFKIAVEYVKKEKYDKADEIIKKIKKDAKDFLWETGKVIITHITKGEFKKAEEMIETTYFHSDSTSLYVLAEIFIAYMEKGIITIPKKILKMAESYKLSDPYRSKISIAYAKRGDIKEARKYGTDLRQWIYFHNSKLDKIKKKTL